MDICASPVALVVKNPPASAGGLRDIGSIPGLGRYPGRGHGHPLQCSCLENPVDRGVWWAAVHRVLKGHIYIWRVCMCVCVYFSFITFTYFSNN